MNNPYSVLGISENATDDEVKKAYRELSRKYHPDSYVNNPLKDLAEDKFKEVQEAYDQIMKQREQGSSYGYGYGSAGGSYGGAQNSYGNGNNGYGGYGNYGSQNSYTTDTRYQNVCNFINFRQYRNALNELNRMPNRDGRWYYLSAIANAGIGNNFQANNDIAQAVSMEPNNQEYRNFMNQLQMNQQRYQNNYNYGGGQHRGNSDCGTGNFCCDLWVADTCCECMGGDLCNCM